jgi:hypothetical protein
MLKNTGCKGIHAIERTGSQNNSINVLRQIKAMPHLDIYAQNKSLCKQTSRTGLDTPSRRWILAFTDMMVSNGDTRSSNAVPVRVSTNNSIMIVVFVWLAARGQTSTAAGRQLAAYCVVCAVYTGLNTCMQWCTVICIHKNNTKITAGVRQENTVSSRVRYPFYETGILWGTLWFLEGCRVRISAILPFVIFPVERIYWCQKLKLKWGNGGSKYSVTSLVPGCSRQQQCHVIFSWASGLIFIFYGDKFQGRSEIEHGVIPRCNRSTRIFLNLNL